jgi:hypothetical protein
MNIIHEIGLFLAGRKIDKSKVIQEGQTKYHVWGIGNNLTIVVKQSKTKFHNWKFFERSFDSIELFTIQKTV